MYKDLQTICLVNDRTWLMLTPYRWNSQIKLVTKRKREKHSADCYVCVCVFFRLHSVGYLCALQMISGFQEHPMWTHIRNAISGSLADFVLPPLNSASSKHEILPTLNHATYTHSHECVCVILLILRSRADQHNHILRVISAYLSFKGLKIHCKPIVINAHCTAKSSSHHMQGWIQKKATTKKL